MRIRRCGPAPESLEQFYRERSLATDHHRIGALETLSLLERLAAHPDPCEVWALTSEMEGLCLLERDDPTIPPRVIWMACDSRDYFIKFLMPPALAPWPDAYMEGQAHSEDEAFNMILTGMRQSQGWPDP